MERQFGMGAIHIAGAHPEHLPKPGGQREHGYEATQECMLTPYQILKKKELKQPKFSRENHLFHREINVCNHCRMHSCSAYCLKSRVKAVPYNEALHQHMDSAQVFTNKKRPKNDQCPYPS
mmetsp:Transcript_23835/g.54107  ORF Transcript_23835/g.54107 Transcript_23835/m.54107 type:complete len:121 (+) Transcript_23835:242-604(+)